MSKERLIMVMEYSIVEATLEDMEPILEDMEAMDIQEVVMADMEVATQEGVMEDMEMVVPQVVMEVTEDMEDTLEGVMEVVGMEDTIGAKVLIF